MPPQGKYGIICLVGFLFIEISSPELLPNPITGYSRSFWFQKPNQPHDVSPPKTKVKLADVSNSLHFGTSIVDRLETLEANLRRSRIEVGNGTAAHVQSLDSRPEVEALRQGKDALIAAKASVYFMNTFCNRLKSNSQQCAKQMSKYLTRPVCGKTVTICDGKSSYGKYRSATGSCNHPSDRDRGESFTGYSRLLFAEYQDGIHTPRRSVLKRHDLPSPRAISSALVKDEGVKEGTLTLAVMLWGQFIGHDLYHTTSSKMLHSGESIQCCTQDGNKLLPRYNHPLCSPIAIPRGDEFYSKHNQKCMTYVRSVSALKSDCSLGPLEQLNQATHYLDGSQIYGSTNKKMKDLRSGIGGKLRTSVKNGNSFLPLVEDSLFNCPNSNKDSCFKAGDSRVNSQPQLTAMHTLWNREHNRLASILSEINPHWNDERIFQEARRIVIAELQHITYNEWLPNILSHEHVVKISEWKSSSAFNEAVDPSVSNAFATAAFRFLKSMIPGDLNLVDEKRRAGTILRLAESFNSPEFLGEGKLDGLLRGISSQMAEKVDFHYTKDVTNLMYGNGKTGLDIVSLDIQRGRDHGLPGYAKFRTLCGLPEVKNFEDFSDLISRQDVRKLSKIYKHPNDVDLFVGGILESSREGSVLGPTFSCIVTDQFFRTKIGDRFFYTFTKQPHPFTKNQLEEIGKVSLARIFCDNSDGIASMQPDAFHIIDKTNDLVRCNASFIPRMSLESWRE